MENDYSARIRRLAIRLDEENSINNGCLTLIECGIVIADMDNEEIIRLINHYTANTNSYSG
jgi:hypothetical protein